MSRSSGTRHALCRLVAGAAALLTVLPTGAAVASPADVEEDVRRYIVRLDDSVDAEARAGALEAASDAVAIDHVFTDVFEGFAGALPEDEVARLHADPRVRSIEVDPEVRVDVEASAAGASFQADPPWGLDRIDQRALPLSGSYAYPNSGAGVTVYVVDSGIRSDHVDFDGRVRAGVTAVDDGYGTSDCDGHGTHVAGTVGGSTFGVAKAVTLRSVRVLDCTGTGFGSGIIAGLDWIVRHHEAGRPAVANLSLGMDGTSAALDAAVQAVIDDGVVTVVAAGNDGVPACGQSPARLPAAVTVGATASTDASPPFSNYGSCLDLFAPGASIRSAAHSSTVATRTMSGTSMAAPHVAGAAAVLLAAEPHLTPAQVASRLVANATTGVVSNARTGSPNRLLHSPPPAAPPPVPAPANDHFAQAAPLSLTGPTPLTGSNVGATREPDEPHHVLPGGRSVWWRFTAPTAGAVTLTTEGSSFDTLLAVYVGGSLATLTRVAGNDDHDGAEWSRVQLPVTAGTSYSVAVDGYPGSGNGSGSVRLHVGWAPVAAPAAPVAFDGDASTTQRVTDATPVAAAVSVSRRRFVDAGRQPTATHRTAAHAVLSRDDTFPDSLTGAPLSATGPLLFSTTGHLPAATAGELRRVLPADATVYLLGGEAALSGDVAAQVSALGYRVVRLAGPSRIETALRIADEVRRLHPGNRDVLVARAYGAAGNPTSGWADSVTGGAFGASSRIPVILSTTSSVHPATAAWVARDNPTRSWLLGGGAALSDTVLRGLPRAARVAGAERTSTAAALATGLWGAQAHGSRRFVLINGFDAMGWAHGLAAAGAAADAQAPMLLVTPSTPAVPAATRSLVSACGDAQVDLLLVGSTTALPAATVRELDLLDGGGC